MSKCNIVLQIHNFNVEAPAIPNMEAPASEVLKPPSSHPYYGEPETSLNILLQSREAVKDVSQSLICPYIPLLSYNLHLNRPVQILFCATQFNKRKLIDFAQWTKWVNEYVTSLPMMTNYACKPCVNFGSRIQILLVQAACFGRIIHDFFFVTRFQPQSCRLLVPIYVGQLRICWSRQESL